MIRLFRKFGWVLALIVVLLAALAVINLVLNNSFDEKTSSVEPRLSQKEEGKAGQEEREIKRETDNVSKENISDETAKQIYDNANKNNSNNNQQLKHIDKRI